jgi:hypothetical protein
VIESRHKTILLGCALLHVLVIALVCCRDTFAVLAGGGTILPSSLTNFWERCEAMAAAILGERLAASNPLHQVCAAYLHGAGIEAGYGFFAPNVPNNYKLVFEIHNATGQVQYELPEFSDVATGLRFATLLDYLGQTRYPPLREVLLKMLVYRIWQHHPEAKTIRAVLGFIELPTPAQFVQGRRESYHFLYAYDFSFHDKQTSSQPP